MQNPITSIVGKLRHIIIAGERNSKSKKVFLKKQLTNRREGYIIELVRKTITYPATHTYHDSVAQLGERYLDRVEVAGSSPVGIIA